MHKTKRILGQVFGVKAQESPAQQQVTPEPERPEEEYKPIGVLFGNELPQKENDALWVVQNLKCVEAIAFHKEHWIIIATVDNGADGRQLTALVDKVLGDLPHKMNMRYRYGNV